MTITNQPMTYVKEHFTFLNLGISICLDAGLPIGEGCVLLGHSDISTALNLYVHPDMKQKNKCIDAMDKLFK